QDALTGDDSVQLLQELLAYFSGKFPEDHPFAGITPFPERRQPELFMLGSSDGGMKIATQLGLAYAFAGQINPDWAVPVLRAYKEQFQPSEFCAKPYSILSIIVICAETDEKALELSASAKLQWARWGTGQFRFAPPSHDEARSHTFTSEEKM